MRCCKMSLGSVGTLYGEPLYNIWPYMDCTRYNCSYNKIERMFRKVYYHAYRVVPIQYRLCKKSAKRQIKELERERIELARPRRSTPVISFLFRTLRFVRTSATQIKNFETLLQLLNEIDKWLVHKVENEGVRLWVR